MGFIDDMIEDGFSDPMDYMEYMVDRAMERQMEMIDEQSVYYDCEYYPRVNPSAENSEDENDSED
jgi:hypothetical protein